jgi:hypothetical protein
MATAAPCVPSGDDAEARIKLTCSHGGRLLRCGPGGAARYVGGETRVLAVPRAATFRGLAARLSSEVAGGAEVRTVRHRLADDEDVLVSVTCDEELAHMIDEYDRLRATRPSAAFRVFVSTDSGSGGIQQRQGAEASGPPPALMPRVQSEPALAPSCTGAPHIQIRLRCGSSRARRSSPRRRPAACSISSVMGAARCATDAPSASPCQRCHGLCTHRRTCPRMCPQAVLPWFPLRQRQSQEAKATMEMEMSAIREFTRQNVTLL